MESDKMYILAVHNDDTILKLIKSSLEKIDSFQVDYENKPESATEKIINNNYDIIIIDQKLCLSNEVNLQEIINKDELLPLIICISDSSRGAYEKFDQLSKVFDHISKDEIQTPYFLRTLYYASILVKIDMKNEALMQEFQEKIEGEKELVLKKTRHDLSNILTMIIGNTELLLFGKYELSEKIRVKIEIIYNAATEMMEKLREIV